MKISYKVPLIGTAVILTAFALFSVFQYKMIEDSLYEQTENNIKEISVALDSEITNWLNERLRIIQSMSEQISKNPTKPNALEIMNSSAFASTASYFYTVFASDGKLVSNTDLGVGDSWDGRTRPWYQLASRHGQAMMTEPYADSVDNRLLITAVQKVYSGGTPKAVIAADIELKAVSDAVNAVNFNQSGYAFLVDEMGKIITYPDKGFYGRNISELYAGKVPHLSSSLQEKELDGKKVLTTFFPLENYRGSENKWYIGIIVDKAKVFSPAYELGRNAIIAAILTVLISSLIFYFFMLNALIKPVHQLAKQSDEISRGQLKAQIESVDRNDEIGELAQSVQRMQKALKMAMSSLAKARKNKG